jgi:hypothetical protein
VHAIVGKAALLIGDVGSLEHSDTDTLTCHVRGEYDSCKELPFYREHEGRPYCVLHLPREDKKDDFKAALRAKLDKRDCDFSGAYFPTGTSNFENYKFLIDVSFREATFCGEANFQNTGYLGYWVTDCSGAKFLGRSANFFRAKFKAEGTTFARAEFRGEYTTFVKAEFAGMSTTNFARVEFKADYTYFGSTKFRGWGVTFNRATFDSKELTSFASGVFDRCLVDFRNVEFSGKVTEFAGTTFVDASTEFIDTKFGSALTTFSAAQFNKGRVTFHDAEFTSTRTEFRATSFSGPTLFNGASFTNKVTFLGNVENTVFSSEAQLHLDHCKVDRPELLTFNTVLLRPAWFINTDARKFDFTEVTWHRLPNESGSLTQTIEALEGRTRAAAEALKGHTNESQTSLQ